LFVSQHNTPGVVSLEVEAGAARFGLTHPGELGAPRRMSLPAGSLDFQVAVVSDMLGGNRRVARSLL